MRKAEPIKPCGRQRRDGSPMQGNAMPGQRRTACPWTEFPISAAMLPIVPIGTSPGFQKWGMTSSMIAADIISSMIAQKPYEIAAEGGEVFSPHRFTKPTSSEGLWDDVKTIGSGLLREIFSMPEEEAAAVQPGHGGVVEYKGEKVGVFRDEQSALHVVSTKCRHMGCQLAWNPEERSWDCPCHGSRFNINGEVVSGPAVKPLDNH